MEFCFASTFYKSWKYPSQGVSHGLTGMPKIHFFLASCEFKNKTEEDGKLNPCDIITQFFFLRPLLVSLQLDSNETPWETFSSSSWAPHARWSTHAVCKLKDNLKQNPSSWNGNEFSSPSPLLCIVHIGTSWTWVKESMFAIIYDKTNNISWCVLHFTMSSLQTKDEPEGFEKSSHSHASSLSTFRINFRSLSYNEIIKFHSRNEGKHSGKCYFLLQLPKWSGWSWTVKALRTKGKATQREVMDEKLFCK